MCSLHLTNKTDAHVGFRITEESHEPLGCLAELPMHGIVPPGSTSTLVVTTGHTMKLEEEAHIVLVLKSSKSGNRYAADFKSQSECDEFFEEAEEIGYKVHEVTLKSSYAAHRDTKSKYYNEFHPLKHRFYPGVGESIPCSLHLTNETDEDVAFRLLDRCNKSYLAHPLYGGVPPRSTCTLIFTKAEEWLANERGADLVLQSSISRDKNAGILSSHYRCEMFLEEAKRLGHAVYEVVVKAVHTPRRGETTSEPTLRPTVVTKHIFFVRYSQHLGCMDAHPTKPWIVIGHHHGNISVWNHEIKTTVSSIRTHRGGVESIKFHPTEDWIVAVTHDHSIHVYRSWYFTINITETAIGPPLTSCSYAVGVHPTKPYVLSASMKLWDSDKNWECTHTYGTSDMFRVVFNPEDPNSFATTSLKCFVEVWSLDSPEPVYTLNGHLGSVKCVDYLTRSDGLCLITGSGDATVKIWDLQKRACVHTIEGFMCPVTHVISIPGRPYLVACSENGTIHVWSSTDFRLKKIVNMSGGGRVLGLVCLPGSTRIAVGQEDAISIMDIEDGGHDDEEVETKRIPDVQWVVNQVVCDQSSW